MAKSTKPISCSYPYCENGNGKQPDKCMAVTYLENQAKQGGSDETGIGGGPYMEKTRWEKIYGNISVNAAKYFCFLVHTLPELYARLTEGKRSRGEFK